MDLPLCEHACIYTNIYLDITYAWIWFRTYSWTHLRHGYILCLPVFGHLPVYHIHINNEDIENVMILFVYSKEERTSHDIHVQNVTVLPICVWFIATSKVHNFLISDQNLLKLSPTYSSTFSACITIDLISGWNSPLMLTPYLGVVYWRYRGYNQTLIYTVMGRIWIRAGGKGEGGKGVDWGIHVDIPTSCSRPNASGFVYFPHLGAYVDYSMCWIHPWLLCWTFQRHVSLHIDVIQQTCKVTWFTNYFCISATIVACPT